MYSYAHAYDHMHAATLASSEAIILLLLLYRHLEKPLTTLLYEIMPFCSIALRISKPCMAVPVGDHKPDYIDNYIIYYYY